MNPSQTPTEICIEVLNGKRAGLRIASTEGKSISVGREITNEISLDERGVSRRHCRLIFAAGRWFIEDLGSMNGVQLQRDLTTFHIKSDRHEVRTLDEFVIGEARIRVEVLRPIETTELLTPCVRLDATELLQLPNNCEARPANPMRAESTLTPATKEEDQNKRPNNEAIEDLFSAHTITTKQNRMGRSNLPFMFRDYKVIKKIGQGGMGEVFLATVSKGENEGTELAIKFLLEQKEQTEQDRTRFMREMEISTRLKHTSIVDCVDCGQEKGQPFIVMAFCCGGNLSDLLKRAGTINLRRALRLLDRLLAGLEHAHKSGVVHRDLKPPNILLAKDNSGKYLPKISDFGLAKSYLLAGSSGMTAEGTVGGSWGYMPKEQLTNFRFVSPQSDVGSLGAILYECLTLKLPRPLQPNSDPIRVILESKLVPIEELIPDIHPRIARFIMKSLSVEFVDRYKDASQMRAAMRTAAEHAGIQL